MFVLPIFAVTFLCYFTVQSQVPENFDLRDKYPECNSLHKPLNQGQCGGCWAFSTTGVAADHLCINGYTNEHMSAEHQIQCDLNNMACNGGYINKAFDFQIKTGLVPLTCKSYRDTSARRCAEQCDDKTTITPNMIYKINDVKKLDTSDDDIEEVKQYLFEKGSVAASYKVFSEFYDFYKDKGHYDLVYSDNPADPGTFETYHAIKVIGYGTGGQNRYENGTADYWIIQNSWGPSFALGGYFKLEKGRNTLDIENDMEIPLMDPFTDECTNFIDCNECKTATEFNGTTVKCAYCLTTDTCVSVDEKNNPKHGMCPKLLHGEATCPLDDCLAMSHDPIRCATHPGCVYCRQSAKCRKGNTTDQNVGVCTDVAPNTTAVAVGSKCVEFTNKGTCLANRGPDQDERSPCLWCAESHLCLDNNPYFGNGQPLIGHCQKDMIEMPAKSDRASNNDIKPENCSYTTYHACNSDDNCQWDPAKLKCVPGAKDPDAPYDPDMECLPLDCGTCHRKPNCAWCHSTSSCIHVEIVTDGENTTTITPTHTPCTLLAPKDATTVIDPLSTSVSQCTACANIPRCVDCGLNPACVWLKELRMCVPGQTDKNFLNPTGGDFPTNDNTTAVFKMSCDIERNEEGAATSTPPARWVVSILALLVAAACGAWSGAW